jgi:hypothetical protein
MGKKGPMAINVRKIKEPTSAKAGKAAKAHQDEESDE